MYVITKYINYHKNIEKHKTQLVVSFSDVSRTVSAAIVQVASACIKHRYELLCSILLLIRMFGHFFTYTDYFLCSILFLIRKLFIPKSNSFLQKINFETLNMSNIISTAQYEEVSLISLCQIGKGMNLQTLLSRTHFPCLL